MLNFYHVAVSKSKVRVKVRLVVDPCPSKMRARMKDARQNFKQILGKVPEEGMATHSSILAWRVLMDRGAWEASVHGLAELDTMQHSVHIYSYDI